MPLSPQFLDELKSRVAVSDVVAKRVKLIRKGHEHSGLCPFHKEKTPSFTVNDEKGFYHCFGCGAHGSVLDFVMETEGLPFRDAVDRVAGLAGMQVPQDSPEQREREKRRQGQSDILETATAYFERSLRMPEGRAALDYLYRRHLTDDTIARFRLGFAPGSRGALKSHLTREGVDEDAMVAGGLLIRPDDPNRSTYDRFRGRVMFPITDRRGRVIAFGGRILDTGEPKYLNSPETDLFHKGRVLYGLGQAGPAAHKKDRMIVVEGYMDVIALAQAGITEAVAPLGTALTEDQIAALWRVSKNPVLCFDGDAAGQRAAGRAAERALALLKPGFGLRFALLPQGEDPDSLVSAGGAGAVEKIFAAAHPLSDQIWRVQSAGKALATPEERAALEDQLKKLAFQIADRDVRAHYLADFKDRVWQAFRVRRGGGRRPQGLGPRMQDGGGAKVAVDPRVLHERILLAVVIAHPALFDEVGERLGMIQFSEPTLDKLRQDVLSTLAGAPELDYGGLRDHLYQGGHSSTVDALLNATVFDHAFFARPDRSDALAKNGWEETFAHYVHRDIRGELQDAQKQLAEEMTDEVFQRLRQLVAYERRLLGDIDE